MSIQNSRHARLLVLIVVPMLSMMLIGQTPNPAAPSPLDLTATSANVNGAGEEIEFHILKWSTDEERDLVSGVWTNPNPPPAAGRGGARGGGGEAAGGRGAAAPPAAQKTPEVALAEALKGFSTKGYFWTSEVGGYMIRYAYRTSLPNGSTRIVMLTDKRLGSAKNNWQPTGPAAPNAYPFSLIELNLPASGAGEGKASITGTLAIDPNTKTLRLDAYETMPVVIQQVRNSAR